MAKETWKAGNMIYPLPAVMVSAADKEGNQNIITVAWTGRSRDYGDHRSPQIGEC